MGRKAKERIGGGGFVPVTYEMIASKAYRELHGTSLKALILCHRKIKTHVDRHNHNFSFTYPEASKQGIGSASFYRAMRQLQMLGFIDCVVKGGMRFEQKHCSQYRLSQRWKKYGTANFKELHAGYCMSIHGNGDDKPF
jgi:hypothetical protein